MSGSLFTDGGTAGGTFSLDAAQADTVKEEDVVVEDTTTSVVSHRLSLASLHSNKPPSEHRELASEKDEQGLDKELELEAPDERGSAASSHSGVPSEKSHTISVIIGVFIS